MVAKLLCIYWTKKNHRFRFFLFLIHLSIPTGDSRHSSNILTTISLRRGISLNFDDQMSHNLGPLSIVATKKKMLRYRQSNFISNTPYHYPEYAVLRSGAQTITWKTKNFYSTVKQLEAIATITQHCDFMSTALRKYKLSKKYSCATKPKM